MVKFSKELEAQMIPEWKEAFMNYWQLKQIVKKIRIFRKPDTEEHLHCRFFVLHPFRYVAGFFNGGEKHKLEKREDLNGRDLEQLFSEEDEANEFFRRLENELKKVNNFFEKKESEFSEREEILKKQLHILVELKQVFNEPRPRGFHERSDIETTDFSENMVEPGVVKASEGEDVGFITSKRSNKDKKNRIMAMQIDIPATTPMQTITAITKMLREDLQIDSNREKSSDFVNRKKIQSAEKMIRAAFVELYRGLGLLETYRSLNMVGFTKILKKFDKVANQEASETYSKVVKRSHFMSSDKVVRLSKEVEFIFTEHFANDRKRAMQFLRPQLHKDSHMISFLVGLFTGCFVTLFIVYAILARLLGMFSATAKQGDMEIVYRVFSMFALFSLHVFVYGCDLFLWRSSRINYNFIFEFPPNRALKYRDAFLICTSLMTMIVGAMVIHLLIRSQSLSKRQVDATPGFLFLLFFGLLICPFNIFYRSSRNCFLRVIWKIICSPFYKVMMVDFFMADQLTSQIPLLRHLEFSACYFVAGGFRRNWYQICTTSKRYKEFAYVVSFMPYYCRAMQCARRWFDENDIDHLANFGKYISAMLAAGARLTYRMRPTPLWLVLAIVTSIVATFYQLYWDFVKDWGLLNRKSRNPWLRDELILNHNSVYFASIVLNFVLRLAWIETVMPLNINRVNAQLLDFFLASLEIIRRGHWNFYRLENEHLNNVGKFRAVKTVPLPFCEDVFG
ncbi:phosphate transporter PHO1-like [Tasmannia lanceolata]|uniref:phosphate transporter PHO1-like n=1 Tax=Tasmannia lanceolata TaxID=3420 RepID=UPI004062C1C9